ncbi:MAG: hypothetical protein ACI8V5_001839, partial [Limisphaerales bacterium]
GLQCRRTRENAANSDDGNGLGKFHSAQAAQSVSRVFAHQDQRKPREPGNAKSPGRSSTGAFELFDIDDQPAAPSQSAA